jgi:hypothetical protein
MTGRGSYHGGSTVLTQHPRNFEAELKKKAIRARKRAVREQAAFDETLERGRGDNLERILAMDRKIERKIAKGVDKIRRRGKRRRRKSKSGNEIKEFHTPKIKCIVERIPLKRSPTLPRATTWFEG